MTTEQAKLPEGIAEMMAEAKEKGLWFVSPFKHVWITPGELQSAMVEGSFCGTVKWELRDPKELICAYEEEKKRLDERIEELDDKIANIQSLIESG